MSVSKSVQPSWSSVWWWLVGLSCRDVVTVLGGIAPAGWPFMCLTLFLLEWYSRCVKSACHSPGQPWQRGLHWFQVNDCRFWFYFELLKINWLLNRSVCVCFFFSQSRVKRLLHFGIILKYLCCIECSLLEGCCLKSFKHLLTAFKDAE